MALIDLLPVFVKKLFKVTVPVQHIGKAGYEFKVDWCIFETGKLENKFLGESWVIPVDVLPRWIWTGRRYELGYVVDDDLGSAINVERSPGTLDFEAVDPRTNKPQKYTLSVTPRLVNGMLDVQRLKDAYTLQATGRELWIRLLIGVVIGWVIGGAF